MNKINKKDSVYIINLNHDKKRKKDIINEFNEIFELNFIDGIYDENPKKGCFLSHLKCIKYAKDNNLDYIIVLEDDCIKKDNKEEFINKYNIITEYLNNNINEWDMFLGGVNGTQTRNILDKFKYNNLNFFKINKGACFHFVIYNKSCYDFFLNYNFNKLPIDKIWDHKLKAFIVIPFICVQKPSISNILKRYIDLNIIFQKQENYFLRRL